MTFRKNSLSFIQYLCFIYFMALSSVALLIIAKDEETKLLMTISVLSSILMVAMAYAACDEFVTVDEAGIRCKRKEIITWEYTWDQIIRLKKVNYRDPLVLIVIDDHANEPVPYEEARHSFQRGRAARKAIEKYYHAEF